MEIVPVSTRADWNSFVRLQPRGHILQLSGYGDLKREFGWEVERFFLLDEGGDVVGGSQILIRQLQGSNSKMAYIPPSGPYLTHTRYMKDLVTAWDKLLGNKVAYLKWEPGIFEDGDIVPDFLALGFRRSESTIQPPRTIIVDLSISESEILERMNQATRRNIRKALDNKIHYYIGGHKDLSDFGRIMKETADRKEFRVRDDKYHNLAYDLYHSESGVHLFMAKHKNDVVAGIMVFFLRETATYLYGASSNRERSLMPNHGLQWKAMKWAKANGYKKYDLWGVPDASEEELEAGFRTKTDGLWGVYGFKRGWGGKIVRSVGAYDRIYDSDVYKQISE